MTKNEIPTAINPAISLGIAALAGAENLDEEIGLEQNPAPKVALDLYDLIGNPATPLVPGKQAKYAAQKVAVTNAYAAARTAVQAGREFCRLAIGVLKPVLGVRWNTNWNAAGFTTPSLALPRDPVPMLIGFREYFNANNAKQVAAINVTAAQAQLLITGIQQADSAVATARDLQLDLKAARDVSFTKLRNRLSGLRSELEQVLDDDDGRWYDFGFQRPVDGQLPAPVEDLALASFGPGAVLVSWALSSFADNYRVSWRIAGSAEAPTEVGLFTDRQALISGLPSGQQVVVRVTARNDAGETEPTEAAILVS